MGDDGHDLVLLLNQLLTRCKDTEQKTKRQDRSLSRNVRLSTTSFDAEIPRSRTLGGIIEQYFDGSGNEVGTGSGCCQDGRAQRPASPPPKKPILTISRHTFHPSHYSHSSHYSHHSQYFTPRFPPISLFSQFSLFNISLFSPFSLIHTTPISSNLSNSSPPLTTFSSVLFSSGYDGEKC